MHHVRRIRVATRGERALEGHPKPAAVLDQPQHQCAPCTVQQYGPDQQCGYGEGPCKQHVIIRVVFGKNAFVEQEFCWIERILILCVHSTLY